MPSVAFAVIARHIKAPGVRISREAAGLEEGTNPADAVRGLLDAITTAVQAVNQRTTTGYQFEHIVIEDNGTIRGVWHDAQDRTSSFDLPGTPGEWQQRLKASDIRNVTVDLSALAESARDDLAKVLAHLPKIQRWLIRTPPGGEPLWLVIDQGAIGIQALGMYGRSLHIAGVADLEARGLRAQITTHAPLSQITTGLEEKGTAKPVKATEELAATVNVIIYKTSAETALWFEEVRARAIAENQPAAANILMWPLQPDMPNHSIVVANTPEESSQLLERFAGRPIAVISRTDVTSLEGVIRQAVIQLNPAVHLTPENRFRLELDGGSIKIYV